MLLDSHRDFTFAGTYLDFDSPFVVIILSFKAIGSYLSINTKVSCPFAS